MNKYFILLNKVKVILLWTLKLQLVWKHLGRLELCYPISFFFSSTRCLIKILLISWSCLRQWRMETESYSLGKYTDWCQSKEPSHLQMILSFIISLILKATFWDTLLPLLLQWKIEAQQCLLRVLSLMAELVVFPCWFSGATARAGLSPA